MPLHPSHPRPQEHCPGPIMTPLKQHFWVAPALKASAPSLASTQQLLLLRETPEKQLPTSLGILPGLLVQREGSLVGEPWGSLSTALGTPASQGCQHSLSRSHQAPGKS